MLTRFSAALVILLLMLPTSAAAASKSHVAWREVTAANGSGADFGNRFRAMLVREALRAKWRDGALLSASVSAKVATVVEVVDEDGPRSTGRSTARATVLLTWACAARMEIAASARGRLVGASSVEERALVQLARRVVAKLARAAAASCSDAARGA
ncbi:MAG: hypothetical protein HOO96_15020 [Polyangiaceae bacterium]|nr:hypothetical protein [Polyangiaceae bacterium]